MCGFVGGNNPNWHYGEAVQAIRHRGPDSQKVTLVGDVTLGFARLAVVDPTEAADQPMSTERGDVILVFNGEIYGYKDLRSRLGGRNHCFRTTSDTEVLLRAYVEWGDGWVDHLDGMFCVVIYDVRSRKLKLFRDRAGIKPLYYFFDGQNFAFASELKALRTLCHDIRFDVDHTALYDFLTYRYIPAPKTLYRHVYKLPPAHTFSFDLEKRNIERMRRYWSLDVQKEPLCLSAEEAGERLRELVDQSVANQLLADVPVGCFLSGGVDSSAVVASASAYRSNLKTFSIGFDISSHTETAYARIVAQLFKTEHYEETLSFKKAQEFLLQMAKWYDEPFGDTSALPTFLVAQLARKHVTVVLTGDGGDEVFGGYRWYPLFKYCSLAQPLRFLSFDSLFNPLKNCFSKQSLPHKICNGLEAVFSTELTLYAKLLRGLVGRDKQRYAEQWGISKDYDDFWYFRQYWRDELPILTRLQYLDFHTYLPDDILTKVDRVTMAVSLEARVPYLSRDVVEFVFSLDEKLRYLNGHLKGLFRNAFRNRLPGPILERRKKGFSVPRTYCTSPDFTDHEVLLRDYFNLA